MEISENSEHINKLENERIPNRNNKSQIPHLNPEFFNQNNMNNPQMHYPLMYPPFNNMYMNTPSDGPSPGRSHSEHQLNKFAQNYPNYASSVINTDENINNLKSSRFSNTEMDQIHTNLITEELLQSKANIKNLEQGYEQLKNKVEALGSVIANGPRFIKKDLLGANERKSFPDLKIYTSDNVEPLRESYNKLTPLFKQFINENLESFNDSYERDNIHFKEMEKGNENIEKIQKLTLLVYNI